MYIIRDIERKNSFRVMIADILAESGKNRFLLNPQSKDFRYISKFVKSDLEIMISVIKNPLVYSY